MNDLAHVRILFFGATAEITRHRRVEMEISTGSKATGILEKLVADYPHLAKHRLRFSVNQQYATGDETLNDGDEIAIFTAVSGG